MAQLNVQDYGAAGDGASDDTDAIQAALDSASDGDTVYLPAGEYLISSGGSRGPILTIPTGVDNLTVTGDPGYNETRVFLSQNEYSSSDHFLPMFRTSMGDQVISGLEIRNLTLDGNKPSTGEATRTQGLQFYPSGAGGGHDILVEDCWIGNFSSSGIVSREGGITYNRVSSVNNQQNFGVSARDDSMAGSNEYDIVIRDCVSKNARWVGVDHNQGGKLLIDGLYSENNGNSGLKSTKDNRLTRVQNATFQSENHFAAVRTNIADTTDLPDPPLSFSLDTVAIRDAVGGGIYLSGDDSSIQNSELVDGPVEIRNCGGDSGGSDGGITFHSAAGGNVGELRVIGTAAGPGVQYNANHDLTIDTYYHAGNQGGAVGTWNAAGDLTINSQINDDPGQLATPAESDVGAWTGDSGSSTEPEPEPTTTTASLATAGGSVLATSASLQTDATAGGGSQTSSATVVEDFEGYASGTALTDTANWTGAGSFSTGMAVTAGTAAQGEQSATLDGSYYYNAAQSTAGDGLATYPSADCTIRVATYIEDGLHDIAFGVPSDETNFNENCYRIRGGPEYGGNPILRRTVNGSSEPLATLGSDFPTNTWVEHVVEFEATGSEVVLTYYGYEWDSSTSSWVQFESGTQGVDTGNYFANETGIGLATYRANNGAVRFDQYRVAALGDTEAPTWTPVDS